jgi:hypothetical protein
MFFTKWLVSVCICFHAFATLLCRICNQILALATLTKQGLRLQFGENTTQLMEHPLDIRFGQRIEGGLSS